MRWFSVVESSLDGLVRAGLRRPGAGPALSARPFAAAQRFQERRSGLFAPASSVPRPVDFFQSFATGIELIGWPTSPEEIHGLVATQSLTNAMAFCSHWLAALDAADDNAAVDRKYVETYFVHCPDPNVLTRANRLIRRGHRILIPQALLMLAKTALWVCPEEEQPAQQPDSHMPLVGALMGVCDYLDSRNRDQWRSVAEPWGAMPSDLSLELVVNQYFNSVYDKQSQLARFRRIYQQLMPSLAAQKPLDYPDFEGEFLKATGLPLQSVITVAMTAWIYCFTGTPPLLNLNSFEHVRLPRDEVRAVLELLSTDRTTAAEKIADDVLDSGFAWTFSVFGENPLIRLGDDGYVVVSPRLLAERVFGGLIYWDIAGWGVPHLNTKRGKQLRNLVADAVEDYVGEVLRAIAPPAGGERRVYSEDDLLKAFSISRQGQKVCDFVVDYGDAFVLVEVNSHRLTRASAVGRSTDAVDHDLEMLIFKKKVKQFEATIKALREGESKLTGCPAPANRCFHPVLVTDDQFPNSPVTRARIQERLAAEGLLQGADVTQLEILSLQDVDVLEGIAEHGGPPVAEILARKAEGNLSSMDLLSYLQREEQLTISYSERVMNLSLDLLKDATRDVDLPTDLLDLLS